MLYYTGIGSRSTPPDVQKIFQHIAGTLAQDGYVLRSGAAPGADTAFEYGCKMLNGAVAIYLPWRGFNKNSSPLWKIPPEAFKIAESIHPNWRVLRNSDRQLHARNCMQILGLNLDTPSSFVVCWTKNGKKIGGTRTALVLAERYEIPIYNFGAGNVSDLMVKIAGHFRTSESRLGWKFS